MPDYKIVYAILERGPRRHWLRVGLAFVNRDGSLNVRLDAVPLSGQLQIRDEPKTARLDEESAPPNAPPPAKESP